MNQKLTLSVEQAAIEQGKKFATRNGTSLSHIVEVFLVQLGEDNENAPDIPLSKKLQSLVGIGSGTFTEKDYRQHLLAKNE